MGARKPPPLHSQLYSSSRCGCQSWGTTQVPRGDQVTVSRQSVPSGYFGSLAEGLTRAVAQGPAWAYDASAAERIGLHEAMWLVLAAHSAARSGRSVSVLLPDPSEAGGKESFRKRRRTLSFLARWDFLRHIRILDVHSADHLSESDYDDWVRAKDASRILEARRITSLGDARELESQLSDVHAIADQLDEYALSAFVSSGRLANVVARELSKNMVDHAGVGAPDGPWGMVASQVVRKASPELARKRLLAASPWERQFFETVGQEAFLEFCVSDDGPGIQTTIAESYRHSGQKSPQSEDDLPAAMLLWAFEEYSTSKPKAERRARDGLYWVVDFIRRFHGWMTVFSGGSAVVFDHLGGRSGQLVLRHDLPLEGTHYVIRIPLSGLPHQPRADVPVLLASDPPPGSASRRDTEYIRLRGDGIGDEEADRLFECVERAAERGLPLLVDVLDTRWSKDEVEPLVSRLVDASRRGVETYLYGINPSIWTSIIESRAFEDALNGGPLVAGVGAPELGSRHSSIQWIGLSEDGSDEFGRFLVSASGREGVPGEVAEWADLMRSNPQYFTLRGDHISRSPATSSCTSDLALAVLERRLREEIDSLIEDQRNVVFQFPSGYRSLAHIDVSSLLASRAMDQMVYFGLSLILEAVSAEATIVSAGVAGLELVLPVASQTAQRYAVFFDSRRTLVDAPDRGALGSSDSDTVVLVDILGTGRTSAQLAARCRLETGKEPLAIVTVVDTSESELRQKDGVPVHSLVQYPVKKYLPGDQLPRDVERGLADGTVESVEVDLQARGPLRRLASQQLWDDASLWESIFRSGSVTARHHVYEKHLHHPYYISPTRFLQHAEHRYTVAGEIRKRFAGHDPDVILYPRHPEMRELAKSLALCFADTPLTIPATRGAAGTYRIASCDAVRSKRVLVIDSGTVTGLTLQATASELRRCQPEQIGYFVLFNRLPIRDLKDILGTHERTDEFLVVGAEVGLPAYESHYNCPLCMVARDKQSRANRYTSQVAKVWTAWVNKELARDRDIRELTFDHMKVLRFWNRVQTITPEAAARELSEAMESSSDVAAKLLYILFLASRVHGDVATVCRSEVVLNIAEGILREPAPNRSDRKLPLKRYRASKVLTHYDPERFVKCFPDLLDQALEYEGPSDAYYVLVDGAIDIRDDHAQLSEVWRQVQDRVARAIQTDAEGGTADETSDTEEALRRLQVLTDIRGDLSHAVSQTVATTAAKRLELWGAFFGWTGSKHTPAGKWVSIISRGLAEYLADSKEARPRLGRVAAPRLPQHLRDQLASAPRHCHHLAGVVEGVRGLAAWRPGTAGVKPFMTTPLSLPAYLADYSGDGPGVLEDLQLLQQVGADLQRGADLERTRVVQAAEASKRVYANVIAPTSALSDELEREFPRVVVVMREVANDPILKSVLASKDCPMPDPEFETRPDYEPTKVRVLMNAHLLSQVLTELMHNAVNAQSKGRTEVEIRMSHPHPGTTVLHVSDRGPGLPEAAYEDLQKWAKTSHPEEFLSLDFEWLCQYEASLKAVRRRGGGTEMQLTMLTPAPWAMGGGKE